MQLDAASDVCAVGGVLLLQPPREPLALSSKHEYVPLRVLKHLCPFTRHLLNCPPREKSGLFFGFVQLRAAARAVPGVLLGREG